MFIFDFQNDSLGHYVTEFYDVASSFEPAIKSYE